MSATRRPLLPRGWGDLLRQVVIWFGFLIAYQLARGLVAGDRDEALRNAHRVLEAEQQLGALIEPDLQRWISRSDAFLHALAWTYWISQFVVVSLALLWVYLRRIDAYPRFRNTIIVANTLGLVGYVVLPTAPPRMLPEHGFVDTLARSEALNHGSALVEFVANPYAAMPSLHVADALIVGFTLAALARHRATKVLLALWPAWVALSLLATANHFWLDVAAGATVALVGWIAVRRFERRRQRAG